MAQNRKRKLEMEGLLGPVSDLQGTGDVRLRSAGQQWELPLLVLNESRDAPCRSHPKV